MALSIPQRKAALVEREVKISEIASDLEVSRQHVWQVLTGRRRSPRVEKAIARAMGKRVEDVFAAA